MARYARQSGLVAPSQLIFALQDSLRRARFSGVQPAAATHLEQIARVHAEFLAIISPATVRVARLMCDEWTRASLLWFLGPVGLVRRLVLLAVSCLILLATASIVDRSLLLRLVGSTATTYASYLLAIALGAIFSGLFDVKRAIRTRRFDPAAQLPHWLRIAAAACIGHASLYVSVCFTDAERQATHTGLALAAGLVTAVSGVGLSLMRAFHSAVRSDSADRVVLPSSSSEDT